MAGVASHSRPRAGRQASSVLAGSTICAWVGASLLAYGRFPGRFSPQNGSTFSELADRGLNPRGASLARAGWIGAGALMVALFVSVGWWRRSGDRTANRFLRAMQVAGGVAGLALVMLTVTDEAGRLHTHLEWTRVFFLGSTAAMLASLLATRRAAVTRPGLWATTVVGYAMITLSAVFHTVRWLEWPDVACVGVFIALVGRVDPTRPSLLARERVPHRRGAPGPTASPRAATVR
jgi:hypothetical protein